MQKLLATLVYFGSGTKNIIWRVTARDLFCVTLIIILATATRLPAIEHPSVTEYDEVTYADYSLSMLAGRPFVDIHPPLAKIFFAEVARRESPFANATIPIASQQPFGEYPYVLVRTAIALLGILLPLVIYAIGRVLEYKPRVALLPALFIVFDSAFIIYSRVILPETLLLLLNFLAILAAFISVKAERGWRRILFLLISGFALGGAISIKWTALGVVAAVGIIYLCYKRFWEGVASGSIAIVCYVAIFTLGLMIYSPNGGASNNFQADPNSRWVSSIEFPPAHEVLSTLKFLPTLHAVMFKANYDPFILEHTLPSLGVYSWPIAKNVISFWRDADSKREVIMGGNAILWVLSAFVLFFELFWIGLRMRRTKLLPKEVDRDELLLLFGYAVNFLPFFLIHRPMYLYHYFTALVFLFLLLPKVAPRIVDCLGEVTRDKLFARVFIALCVLSCLVNFFLTLATTYGLAR